MNMFRLWRLFHRSGTRGTSSRTSALAIVALLLIGPLGGLVSIRYAVRIEPLKALGLSS